MLEQDLTTIATPTAAESTSPRHAGLKVLLLLMITAFGFGLRVYKIDQPSMWVDELFSIKWSKAYVDGHVGARPLAYLPTVIGLWTDGVDFDQLDQEKPEAWQSLGVTEYGARMPSAIIGGLSLLILGFAVWRTFGATTALISMLLLAVAPWHLWSSQIARFYALQFLFYNLCFVFYIDATKNNRRESFFLVAICLIAAFASQLTSLMILTIFGLDWLLNLRAKNSVRWGRWGWACLFIATAVCMLWWFSDFILHTENTTKFKGNNQSVKALLFGLPYMVGVPLAGFAIFSGFWLLKTNRRLAILLALGVIMPLCVMVSFKFIDYDVHIRYMMISLFSWLLLVTLGLIEVYRKLRPHVGTALAIAPLIALLAASGLAVNAYYTGGKGYRPRWREAFSYVDQHAKPGEMIYTRPQTTIIARYYLEHGNVAEWPWAWDGGYITSKGKPAWAVFWADTPLGSFTRPKLETQAELKKYYSTRILQPASAIEVYWFDPSNQPELTQGQNSDQDQKYEEVQVESRLY
ncbi:glycosyltransferase family 39 protein [Poriferisphaera sp. WC338]|uniref:glycosyltransferase family 39 protein n=1 Tax=Poriferisphaera sp. WC338 TaxID=3425129 RepID=UPI003D81586E